MISIKDYRKEKPYQLYKDSMDFGPKQAAHYPNDSLASSSAYWVAWYAARRTASAMLAEAKIIGLSDEQWERLRKIAAHVATD